MKPSPAAVLPMPRHAAGPQISAGQNSVAAAALSARRRRQDSPKEVARMESSFVAALLTPAWTSPAMNVDEDMEDPAGVAAGLPSRAG